MNITPQGGNKVPMKRIVLIILGFLLVVGLSLGALMMFGPKETKQQSSNEPARGIAVSAQTKFEDVSVEAVPVISAKPAQNDGWKIDTEESSPEFTSLAYTNGTCSVNTVAQLSPLPQEADGDFALSRDHAEAMVAAAGGELSELYVVRGVTQAGTLQYYSGVYTPKTDLTHPESTTPTKTGGSTAVSGKRSAFIAVRSIDSPIGDGESTLNSAGVVTMGA